jgi:hypothetical protein
VLKGRRFIDIAMIQAKLQEALSDFQTVCFTESFKGWHNQWARCMSFHGDYFEGDNID